MQKSKNKTAKKAVRKFDTGAFRDTDSHKLQFTRSLSPIVLIRYVEFMREHNNTADGQRDEGNWKKGFTRKSYMESKFRHLIETWLIQDGLKEYLDLDPKQLDNVDDLMLEELIESLCAEFFNTQGFLHVLLLEQRERREKLKEDKLSKKKNSIKATRKISIKTKQAAKRNERRKIPVVHYYPEHRRKQYGTYICGIMSSKRTIETEKIGSVTCKTCKKIIECWNQ